MASVIVLGLAFVLTLVFIGVRGCFSNWELVTLPPLAATALLASVADAPAFVVAGIYILAIYLFSFSCNKYCIDSLCRCGTVRSDRCGFVAGI